MVNKSDNPPVPSASGFDEFVEDQGIDLRHYWRVVLRYKWGILGLVFAVGLFTTIWAYSLQPVYRATATLIIGGNQTLAASKQEDTSNWGDRERFLSTQYELLKSREVARAVLDQLGANKDALVARLTEQPDVRFQLA